MSKRMAAVDIGNEGLKAYAGGLNNELYIPNVIAEIGAPGKLLRWKSKSLTDCTSRLSPAH
ncbi:hypothetical protein [Effusibacillus consociatus]|uniref:Actin-like protein N-terminal domain-containing protein n=1 Tax=Effusibacillus consociatus TaxID=1117041 RepID=A0ABV9Q1P2_9BACL